VSEWGGEGRKGKKRTRRGRAARAWGGFLENTILLGGFGSAISRKEGKGGSEGVCSAVHWLVRRSERTLCEAEEEVGERGGETRFLIQVQGKRKGGGEKER